MKKEFNQDKETKKVMEALDIVEEKIKEIAEIIKLKNEKRKSRNM